MPRSKLEVPEKVIATLPLREGGWKLRQASLSEEAGGGSSIEARRSKQVDGRFRRKLEDLGAMVEGSKVGLEGWEKLGFIRLERLKKGQAGKGFGPLLGPGLGRIKPERRIVESVRFCDSTIQYAIRSRFHNPDSPSRIGIGDPPLNRKIVRF
ncbi:hypothetical protein CDL15_Pgr001099 [Punica granatum]|uniref:Uncharacterized protein n=1 Tax=Punica granatum TaxID=22663 RepID=A0A218WJK3_PUNGR|nr:hypothetical protein CDL15_Pgr001099 [Punica granatum]